MKSLRLLPVVIAVAVLMLSVRIGDIWFGVRDGGFSVAQAAEDEEAAEDHGDAPAEDHGAAADGEEAAHGDAGEAADEHAADDGHGEAGADQHADAGHDDAGFSIEDLTIEEIEVLQDLSVRRSALEQLERELALREGLLNAAEQRIEVKITEMQSLRDEIGVLIRQYDEQENAELQSVVKIYETMKPKDAARILQDMEPTVLLSIMEQMKERSSAPILASMDAQVARVITSELARRRAIDPPAG